MTKKENNAFLLLILYKTLETNSIDRKTMELNHKDRKHSLFFYALLFLLVLHSFLWVLIPSLLQPNVNLDVAESFGWGQEFSGGYYKHPFLAPWLTYLFSMINPGTLWPVFLLSQICILGTMCCVYWLAKHFLNSVFALVTCFLLALIPYFNYTTPEFNPNVLELLTWSISTCTTFYAIKKPGSHIRWVIAGIFAGLTLLTKYYSVVLLTSFFIFFLTTPAKYMWKKTGLWLGLISFILTILPNIIWLIQADFISIEYAINRSDSKGNDHWTNHLLNPISFFLSQVLILLPLLFIIINLFRNKNLEAINTSNITLEKKSLNEKDSVIYRNFIYIIGFGPILITLLASIITGMKIRSMWGMPLFTWLPLLLILIHNHISITLSIPKLIRQWGYIQTFFIFVFITELFILPAMGKVKTRQHFPGQTVADTISEQWKIIIKGKPLEYVVGSTWLSSTLAFYSSYQPSVITDFNFRKSPWATMQDLQQNGGVVIWDKNNLRENNYYLNHLANLSEVKIQPAIAFRWQTHTQPDDIIELAWAIIPPSINELKDKQPSDIVQRF